MPNAVFKVLYHTFVGAFIKGTKTESFLGGFIEVLVRIDLGRSAFLTCLLFWSHLAVNTLSIAITWKWRLSLMGQYLVNFSQYSWILLKDNQVKLVGIGLTQVKPRASTLLFFLKKNQKLLNMTVKALHCQMLNCGEVLLNCKLTIHFFSKLWYWTLLSFNCVIAVVNCFGTVKLI